jgi:hypothetical protein
VKAGRAPNSSAVDAASVFSVKQTGLQEWIFTHRVTILTMAIHVIQIIVLSGLQVALPNILRFFQRIRMGFSSQTITSIIYSPTQLITVSQLVFIV